MSSKCKVFAKWEEFEIREQVYLKPCDKPKYTYDIDKWYTHHPIDVIDWKTGKKKSSTRSCFSIGTLTYDKKEGCFDFKSVGLRYLEHREEGLESFILDFCKKQKELIEN